jgi:hypothetical protein
MKVNIGKLDRIFRIVLAVILIGIVLSGVIEIGQYLKITLILVSVILIFTATIRVCPLYLPFGIKTCKD